jgi:hypothetical protein
MKLRQTSRLTTKHTLENLVLLSAAIAHSKSAFPLIFVGFSGVGYINFRPQLVLVCFLSLSSLAASSATMMLIKTMLLLASILAFTVEMVEGFAVGAQVSVAALIASRCTN